MTRKRSKYRPKQFLINPMTLLQEAPKAKRNKVMLDFYTALESISKGQHPGENEWRSLSDAVNLVEVIADDLVMLDRSEVLPVVESAVDGMVAAANRYKDGKGMRFDANGLASLREILSIYDYCLLTMKERVIEMAQDIVTKKVQDVLKKNAQAREVVSV